MMKEKANPKRLKGTVLFTVVSVMMVLIVFLMGTLALAATANNRAQSNYQKIQTEATARAVLDAVSQSIREDTAGTGIRMAIYNGQPISVQMSDTDNVYDVTVKEMPGQKRSIYDDGVWKESPVYELSVMVDKTKAETTYSAYVTVNLTEDEEDPPTGGGGGGAFVSLGGSSSIATGGYITGGTYVGIDKDRVTGEEHVINNNDGLINAPLFVNMSATIANGDKSGVHFTAPGDYFVVMGDLKETKTDGFVIDYTDFQWGTEPATGYDYATKTPYVYVDGRLTFDGGSNKISYGVNTADAKVPTNFYLGSIDAKHLTLYGDLFLKDPTAENLLFNVNATSNPESALFNWTEKNIVNKTFSDALYGNIYSKGKMTLGEDNPATIVVEGDLRCDNDVTIKKGSIKLAVASDVVCNGTLTIENGATLIAKNVYAKKILNYGTLQSTGNVYSVEPLEGNIPLVDGNVTTKTWYTNIGWDIQMDQNSRETEEGVTTIIYNVKYKYKENKRVTENGVTTNADAEIELQESIRLSENASQEEKENAFKALHQDLFDKMALYDSEANALVSNSVDLYTPITSVETAYTKDIYPSDYSEANIKSTIGLTTPAPADYSSYERSVSDISSSWTVIDSTSDFNDPGNFYVGGVDDDDAEGAYIVKNSCYIKGASTTNQLSIDKPLYVEASGPLTVVLENVSFSSSNCPLVVDEHAATVQIYIKGTVTFNGGGIYTKYYWNKLVGGKYKDITQSGPNGMALKNVTVHIDEEYANLQASLENPADSTTNRYPNLEIYGIPVNKHTVTDTEGNTKVVYDEQPVLKLTNSNNIVTALVRAPDLYYDQGLANPLGQCTIEYETANGSIFKYGNDVSDTTHFTATSKLKKIGLIGQLIAGEIKIDSNADWGMIYVTIPSDPPAADPDTPETPDSPMAGDSEVLYYNYY